MNEPADKPRRIVHQGSSEAAHDVLVVVSKVKAYVRARSGMNTSDAVAQVLSDYVRRICDRAIDNASREGRKTVMDRDFGARDE